MFTGLKGSIGIPDDVGIDRGNGIHLGRDAN